MTEDTKTKVPPVVKRIAEQTPESPVPICVLVVGMAGSGKTTLMSQLQHSSMDNVDHEGTNEEGEAAVIKRKTEETVDKKPSPSSETDERSENQGIGETDSMPAYCINLDPATLDVPYSPSIDIRDTVDYKQVMKQHRLGPNCMPLRKHLPVGLELRVIFCFAVVASTGAIRDVAARALHDFHFSNLGVSFCTQGSTSASSCLGIGQRCRGHIYLLEVGRKLLNRA